MRLRCRSSSGCRWESSGEGIRPGGGVPRGQVPSRVSHSPAEPPGHAPSRTHTELRIARVCPCLHGGMHGTVARAARAGPADGTGCEGKRGNCLRASQAVRQQRAQRGLNEIRQPGRLGTLLSARLRASAVHAPTPIAARPEKRRPRASRAGCDPPPPLPLSVWMPCAAALWRHRRAPLERRVLSSRRGPSDTSCLLSRRARRSR